MTRPKGVAPLVARISHVVIPTSAAAAIRAVMVIVGVFLHAVDAGGGKGAVRLEVTLYLGRHSYSTIGLVQTARPAPSISDPGFHLSGYTGVVRCDFWKRR
jgi:hypothetical protein